MDSPFFSIIIPVYNDEKNIPRCLDSVLSQTFADFEILLIDDGSTDNCPALCDDYANKDSRIRVFHKDNEGTSKTRQFGIDNAIGDYTIFVDSDDWVEVRLLEEIRKKLENYKSDIIFMDFFEENTAGKERYICQKSSSNNIETVLRLVMEGKLFSCLWNVIINKDLYLRNNISFQDGINYGEDSLFILQLLLNNPIIGYLPEAYYHHSYNYNSFTRGNQKQRYAERVKFLERLPLLLEKYNRNDLAEHNFFPLNDKYEMLCSGVFSKKEYQELFHILLTPYYRKQAGFRKYFLLCLAETALYPLAKFKATVLRVLKNSIFKT
jgi:glycosyltransferase involved in cell wall biosynthesis